MSHNRRNRGSRREEAAPTPEYDPHLLSPSYSQDDEFSAQQPDPYSTGQFYDGYNDQALEDQFSQLNVGGQDPNDYYAYQQQQEPASTGQDPTYHPYSYSTEHAGGAGSYSYAEGSYAQDPSAHPRASDDPAQQFDDVLEQARAGAYTGGAYPGYEEDGAPGPSSGPYGAPEAPLDAIPEHGSFTAESRDGLQEDIEMSQFRLEHSSEFTPGTIFKLMWWEPRGSTSRALPTLATQRVEVTPGFYAGIRRFIVVTSGDGNSSCVPILTYERRACTKSGVNPKTHGIIHGAGPTPRPLRREPRLGIAPVAVDLAGGERLTPESRVNYAKLQTIEHNLKVRIVGRVTDEDLPIVLNAVDECWQRRAYHTSGRHRNRR